MSKINFHCDIKNIIAMHDRAIVRFLHEDLQSSYRLFVQTLRLLRTVYDSTGSACESKRIETNDIVLASKLDMIGTTSASFIIKNSLYVKPNKCQIGEDEMFTGLFSLTNICTEIQKNGNISSSDFAEIIAAVILYNIGLTGHLLAIRNTSRYACEAKVYYERCHDVLKVLYHTENFGKNPQYLEIVSLIHLALCLNSIQLRTLGISSDHPLHTDDSNDHQKTSSSIEGLYLEIKTILDSFIHHASYGGQWVIVTKDDIRFFYQCVTIGSLTGNGHIAAAAA